MKTIEDVSPNFHIVEEDNPSSRYFGIRRLVPKNTIKIPIHL